MILTPLFPNFAKLETLQSSAHTQGQERMDTLSLSTGFILFVGREAPLKHGLWRILMRNSILERLSQVGSGVKQFRFKPWLCH